MMKHFLFTLATISTTLFASAQPSHSSFDRLLKKYVNEKGGVDYKGLKTELSSLDSYLNTLENNTPSSAWADDKALTYWINAYNAATLQLVLKYYPINSIKDLGSSIQIPYINTPWDIKCFKSGDKNLSLNEIEHSIIRKKFSAPRIHFALVCAAVSCPKLRNEAYVANSLESQLTDQTKSFLSDPTKNQISENHLKLSNIFKWYGGDFRKSGTLIEFIDNYTEKSIDKKAKISFMKYYWELNTQ